MMRFFLIGLLLFLAPGTEPRQGGREQTDNSAQVEGFIVSVGASSPVSRAAVVLRSADDAGGIRATAFTGIRATAFTDASGKFAFSNVPPGTYDLSAKDTSAALTRKSAPAVLVRRSWFRSANCFPT